MVKTIAIIGRPNVGKSTLFNRLIAKNSAIVADTPGVTRDYIVETYTDRNLNIELIDHVGLNSEELAQKINDLIEEKILQHPAEYLWMHRRFKSTLGKNFYK